MCICTFELRYCHAKEKPTVQNVLNEKQDLNNFFVCFFAFLYLYFVPKVLFTCVNNSVNKCHTFKNPHVLKKALIFGGVFVGVESLDL